VRKYLLRLGKTKAVTTKFWRPSILLLETKLPEEMASSDQRQLVLFANALKKGGLFVVASILLDQYGPEALRKRDRLVRENPASQQGTERRECVCVCVCVCVPAVSLLLARLTLPLCFALDGRLIILTRACPTP
jgi:hypothetical protein